VLDADAGKIFVFNAGGRLIKELASGDFFKGAASIAVSPSGDRLAIANPETTCS